MTLVEAESPAGTLPASSATTTGLSRTGLVLLFLGTGVAVFLAQLVSIQLWIPPTRLSTVWIHGGFLMGVVLLTPPRHWPGVLIAGAIGVGGALWALGSVQAGSAAILGLLTGMTTLGVAWMLTRSLGGRPMLASLREFLVYLGVVVLGGAVVASSAFLAAASGLGFRQATFQLWRTFVLAAVLGYLTVTPTVVLLVQTRRRLQQDTWWRRLEAALLILLLVLLSGFAFGEVTSRAIAWPVFAVTFPPILVWAAMRFDVLGASGSLLLVTLVSTLSTGRGLGPFVSDTPQANTLSLQLFILGTGVPLLLLAIVLGEQRRTMAALVTTQHRLRGLNRDLIAAREEEATRIARELHDDVGQRLALVSIGLSRLRKAATAGAPPPLEDILRLQDQTGTAAGTLRELSRQLHPAALEHAGLGVALEMQGEEVRQVTGLAVTVYRDAEPSTLPRDIALSLYRVAQEAITNAVRHSGAKSIAVQLRQEHARVLLSVSDDGRGFQPDNGARKGLGLQSLTERVRFHDGELTIDSAPGRGTVVRAAIPIGTGDGQA